MLIKIINEKVTQQFLGPISMHLQATRFHTHPSFKSWNETSKKPLHDRCQGQVAAQVISVVSYT